MIVNTKWQIVNNDWQMVNTSDLSDTGQWVL